VTNSGISTSHSSALTSSLHAQNGIRARSRLSPVREARAVDEKAAGHRPHDKSIESYFEMVTPPPKSDSTVGPHMHKKSEMRPRGSSLPSNTSPAPATVEMSFSRQNVPPIRPQRSALTAVLASSGHSTNPFAELYAAISGRAETASMNVRVFFPHAHQPPGRAMDLNVRKDATVEEVIGFALWNYWEEGWLPKLDEGKSGDDETRSATGWIMRVAESDGEVDEDFPRKFPTKHLIRSCQ
jgi:target of rapamycin complex 2 subunit MAPKAP1